MKKIKYICLTVIAAMIAGVVIVALFLGINGTLYAGGLAGVLAIAGYIAGRRANGDLEHNGFLRSILPLALIVLLAGCDKSPVAVNYPCLATAAMRCCIEISQCFEACTPNDLATGSRGCPVLDICREGNAIVPEKWELEERLPLSLLPPFSEPRSGSPGGGGIDSDWIRRRIMAIDFSAESLDFCFYPCYEGII